MKKAIVCLLSIAALSACASPEEAPAATRDEVYLDTLKSKLPQLNDSNDDALIDAGREVCDYFEDFGSSLTSLGILTEQFYAQGFSEQETATIFVVSTTAYCPEVKDELLSLNTGGI